MMIRSSGRRTGLLLFLALLVSGMAFFAWNRFVRPAATPATTAAGTGEPQRAQVFLGPANSIAIVPFGGESAGQEPAFWAPGLTRELHGLVTRARGFQVTSLNSSFFFQDHSLPLPLIAERLQVSFLLSGEFLVSEGRFQLTAQLFDARGKREIWSEFFEGGLEEIFPIQDAILDALMAAIKPVVGDGLPKSQAVDIRAWSAYLQGLYYRQQGTPSGYDAAEQSFLTALAIAPDYAMASLGLAGLRLEQSAGGNPDPGLVEDARSTLETALRSEPDLASALGLLSYIRRTEDWDWRGALDTAEQALRLSPGDPELMSTASLAMFSLGQFQTAGDLLSQSVMQDPLNLARRLRLGLLQEFCGQNEAALNSYRQVISLNPDFPAARAYRARVKLIQDKPESALKESSQEPDPFWRRYAQVLALSALGRDDEARPLLDQMILEDGDHSAYQVTEILAFRGDIDAAFEWFQRAYEQRDGGMGEVIGNWFLRNLHGDPRWAEMLRRLGLPPADSAPLTE